MQEPGGASKLLASMQPAVALLAGSGGSAVPALGPPPAAGLAWSNPGAAPGQLLLLQSKPLHAQLTLAGTLGVVQSCLLCRWGAPARWHR